MRDCCIRFLVKNKVENVYGLGLEYNRKFSQMHNVSRGGVCPKCGLMSGFLACGVIWCSDWWSIC